jgi:hypothetical protein
MAQRAGRGVAHGQAILLHSATHGAVLLDAGEGTVGQMQRHSAASGGWEWRERLAMVWVSHMHADHHAGSGRQWAPEALSRVLVRWRECGMGSDAPGPRGTGRLLRVRRLWAACAVGWAGLGLVLAEYSQHAAHAAVRPLLVVGPAALGAWLAGTPLALRSHSGCPWPRARRY